MTSVDEDLDEIISLTSTNSSIITNELRSNIRNLNTQLKVSYANECYNGVVLFNHNYSKTIFLKGLTAHSNRKYKLALELFNIAVAITPDNFEYFLSKGVALNNLKQYSSALESYDKSIELNSSNPIVFNYKGVTYMNMELYENSIKCFDSALKLDSTYSQAIKNRKVAVSLLTKKGNNPNKLSQSSFFKMLFG